MYPVSRHSQTEASGRQQSLHGSPRSILQEVRHSALSDKGYAGDCSSHARGRFQDYDQYILIMLENS